MCPDIDVPNNTPRTIFVIPMENESSSAIYGNSNAPYINGLFATAARATMFEDELPSLNSEPHYVWMEAGTNAFSDQTFTTDDDSSASNSTSSTAHPVRQLKANGVYAAKHDPFVFFQDVVGNPPSETNPYCVAHHKPYTAFANDLAAGTIAQFVFITTYTHSSQLKSIEEILGVPVLSKVSSANDFSDMFQPGMFP
jgi:hypothetical protein